MNNARRTEIRAINDDINGLIERLEAVSSAESDAYENMPESLQQGERGERMQEGIDSLENATSLLSEVQSDLEAAVE